MEPKSFENQMFSDLYDYSKPEEKEEKVKIEELKPEEKPIEEEKIVERKLEPTVEPAVNFQLVGSKQILLTSNAMLPKSAIDHINDFECSYDTKMQGWLIEAKDYTKLQALVFI